MASRFAHYGFSDDEVKALEELTRDYEVTDLEAANLLTLARMQQKDILAIAMSKLKRREQ